MALLPSPTTEGSQAFFFTEKAICSELYIKFKPRPTNFIIPHFAKETTDTTELQITCHLSHLHQDNIYSCLHLQDETVASIIFI